MFVFEHRLATMVIIAYAATLDSKTNQCFTNNILLFFIHLSFHLYDTNKTNLINDPSEIQHPKFVNSRLGLTESVHERQSQMRYPSRNLVPVLSKLVFRSSVVSQSSNGP